MAYDGKKPAKHSIFTDRKFQDIVQESGGTEYCFNSNNMPLGAKSFDPPISLQKVDVGLFSSQKPNIPNYIQQGLFGQGQDIKIHIKDLSFDSKSLKAKLMSDRLFSVAYEKARQTGQPQLVNIPTVELQTNDLGFQQDLTIGKVKMTVQGIIQPDINGKPVFRGLAQQGENAEVWAFPGGKRHPLKEFPTWIGRYAPFTQFRTILEGHKPLWIDLED